MTIFLHFPLKHFLPFFYATTHYSSYVLPTFPIHIYPYKVSELWPFCLLFIVRFPLPETLPQRYKIFYLPYLNWCFHFIFYWRRSWSEPVTHCKPLLLLFKQHILHCQKQEFCETFFLISFYTSLTLHRERPNMAGKYSIKLTALRCSP